MNTVHSMTSMMWMMTPTEMQTPMMTRNGLPDTTQLIRSTREKMTAQLTPMTRLDTAPMWQESLLGLEVLLGSTWV